MATTEQPDFLPTGTVVPRKPLPATAATGLIFLERVRIERPGSAGAERQVMAVNVPATFEPLSLLQRERLAAYTQKPLFSVWLLPETLIAAGDVVVREDGSEWRVRAMPLRSALETHLMVLTEAQTADGLFQKDGNGQNGS